MRRRAARSLLIAPALALAILAAACEKDDRLIAQQQIEDSRTACEDGCVDPPPGCGIKGNISERGNKFYHVPGVSKNYDGIVIQPEKGERWFCTEAEALDNGWMKSLQ